MCEKFYGDIGTVCGRKKVCDSCQSWLDAVARKIVELSINEVGGYACKEFILLRVAELLSGKDLGIRSSPESRLDLRAEEVVDLIRAQVKKCVEGNNIHYEYLLFMVARSLIIDFDFKKSFGWATAGEI